jgi:hypothetical protein
LVTCVEVAVPPFAIPKIPVISAVSETVAHVATPAPLIERTNWLVQEVPAYAAAVPAELVTMRADGTEEIVRFVVDAEVEYRFVEVIAVEDAVESVVCPATLAVFDTTRFVVDASVEKSEVEVSAVEDAVTKVSWPLKMLAPVHVLLFARSVEEAAVIVIVPPALKVVPLIVPSEPVR